jgi:hypothetical protein
VKKLFSKELNCVIYTNSSCIQLEGVGVGGNISTVPQTHLCVTMHKISSI